MKTKLLIIFALTCSACSSSPEYTAPEVVSQSDTTQSFSLPDGFNIVEAHPDGYFVRLSSAIKADRSDLVKLAECFSTRFDRIDLCLDSAHERGDEYTSIMGRQVYDYVKDEIYTLKNDGSK